MNNYNKSDRLTNDLKKFVFQATGFARPIINSGSGSYVWDIDGNRYLDLNAGQFCATFGHNYPALNEFVGSQMTKIHHTNTGVLTPETFVAAEKMAHITSMNEAQSIFLSTGAEANECAIRYAKFVSGCDIVLSFDKGYHGLTHALQCLTMGGAWAKPGIPDYLSFQTPDTLYPDSNISSEEYLQACLNSFKRVVNEKRGRIAAVILELILGVGGMIIVPQSFVQQVSEICKNEGILLILDECQTGFGRTGRWFAYQTYGIVPDILVTAKAMGAGFPVSAVTFSKKVADSIGGRLTHFSSHQNDPFAAGLVSFVIDEITKFNILEGNARKGKSLLERLKKISSNSHLLKNPRGIGLMLGFDLPFDMVDKTNRQLTSDLILYLQEEGILIQAIRQGKTFRVLPCFAIEDEDIDFFVEKLEQCLLKLTGKYSHLIEAYLI
ncbi:MAG TPA: aspartate aminotransferase family protein [Candidatus Rifleibacterium sp.]|nr:aspartate aminotransferase family protein [Candidatus Rifleibacterium sp.]